MGRKRTKLSHDPNNTAWSRDSTAYGQKIMLSQGWIPGSILGAASANGNTDANFSYMRTTRRGGNSGLGRSSQSNYDDSHSLDAFQEILGRLNGRPEVKSAAAKITSGELKTVNYLESRWRVLKFVSGGLLGGDRSKDAVKQPEQRPSSPVTQAVTTSDIPADEEADAGMNGIHQRESTKSHSPNPPESQEPHDTVVSRSAHSAASESCDKRRESGAGKSKQRKKRRRVMDSPEQTQQSIPEEGLAKLPTPAVEDLTTPVITGLLSSRHAVRMRNIRQKKMAMMDTKALNEIFMVKT